MLLYPKQTGFVLLLVFVFMQVFILLNWYAMETILYSFQMSRHSEEQDRSYYQAKKILAQIESALAMDLPHCIIPFTESRELMQKPLAWWQEQTCSGNFQTIQYYYAVEPMTIDPCAFVSPVRKTNAAYFRITLFVPNTDETRLFFQSIWVRSNSTSVLAPCQGVQHIVQTGRQSWRELDD